MDFPGKKKRYDKLTDGSQLHNAAREGDLAKVRSLLHERTEVDCKNEEGLTPLHLACRHKMSSVCRFLIESGADINSQDNRGFAPIHIVCHNAFSYKVLSLIIKRGANVNAITDDGKNALHIATMGNSNNKTRSKICKKLLRKGCAINLRNDRGWTPLHDAVHNHQFDICRLLINNGAQVEARTRSGQTALHIVMNRQYSLRDIMIIDLLISRGADINAQDGQGRTPLHHAVLMAGWFTMFYFLSIHKPDPNIRDHDGLTALHFAVIRGNHLIVSVLLDSSEIRVDVNATTTTGCTTLSLAVVSGHMKVVKAVLEHGANCESVVEYHLDVLCRISGGAREHRSILRMISDTGSMFEAARNSDTAKVLYFIHDGVPMNARDSKGRSLLHYAAQYGNEQLMKHLLSQGFELDNVSTDGHTALHLALIYNQYNLAGKLIKHASDKHLKFLEAKLLDKGHTALHLAAAQESNSNYDSLRVVQMLIHSGVTYNPIDIDGRTPVDLARCDSIKQYFRAIDDLLACTLKGTAEQVSEILTKHPTIVNARDDIHGLTALHCSISNDKSLDLVKTLLRHGANVLLANKEGYTALHFASDRGNDALIDILVKECPKTSRKRFVNLESVAERRTPLHLAANEAVARKLLHYGARRNAEDIAGETPYDRATNSDVKRLLDPRGRKLRKAIGIYLATMAHI